MKRLLVALAVLAVVVSPPAHASGSSDHIGECGYSTLPSMGGTTPATYRGVVFAAVVVSAADLGSEPVSATVRCEVRVNGSRVAGADGRGTTVVPVFGEVTFTVEDTDWVELCTVVDYEDDTPTADVCPTREPLTLPPRAVSKVLDDKVWPHADPVVCAAFQLLPDVPGTVETNEQGDVYVYGEPQWDCPPYDIWP